MEKYRYEDFLRIVARLRAEDGCPWDKAQTHGSLKTCLVEECYEVLEGIRLLEEDGEGDNLCEELGDLLLQVVLHARIAQEEGLFAMEDVVQGISEKMIRRHPHVFGGDGQLVQAWEDIKEQEKNGKEIPARIQDQVPRAFPALLRAQKILKKYGYGRQENPFEQMERTLEGVRGLYEEEKTVPAGKEALEQVAGNMLLAAAFLCNALGVQAESALMQAAEAFSGDLPAAEFDK